MPRLPLIGVGILSAALGAATRPAQADPPPIRCHEFEIPIAVPGTTQVFGNNDYGDVVGTYTFKFGPGDGDVHEYGFVRHPDGSFDTVNFPDSAITVAAGINNAGVVVGSWNEYPVAPTYHYYPHGFILGAGGYSSWDVPGSFFTEIFGINDVGTIVGQWSDHNPDEVPGVYRGYMRSASGVSYLDWPDSNGQTEPWDVDSVDRAVGWVSNGHGFLWANGQFTDQLDFQPPAGSTIAFGINDAGRVVGFYLGSDFSQAGFIRSPDGEYKSFDCDGQPELTLYGINNLGSMVGRWLTSSGGNLYGHSFYTDPGIEILPKTTRLKPQRGDQPIEVHFAAPPDLQSATLEIKDPDGKDVTVDPPPVLEPTDPPFRFRLVWDGPWTRNNPDTGLPERLPAGNYTVVVKGTRSGDGSEIESEPYKKVSLIEVKKIELAACGSIAGISCQDAGAVLAPNQGASGPMPGGGKAVFPDAPQPGADYVRSVLVKAELEPDLGPDAAKATVYFRFIDVDDPSANSAPIDNDAGATTSADNRNETAAIDGSKPASPDLGGAAVADFRVSTQQGNNYRVAASTHEPWLADVEGVASSQTGAVTHKSGEQILDSLGEKGPQVTEMVTVWRTLHLELGAFDPSPRTQADLQYDGVWSDLGRRRLDDATTPFFSIRIDGLLDHVKRNGWRGADVNPFAPAGQDFRVGGNNASRLSTRSGNMCSVVGAGFCSTSPPSPADRAYYLRDDLLSSLVNTPADVSILRSILDGVYVMIAPEPGPALPWMRNLSGADQRLLQGARPNSAPYWSVLVVQGFDPETAEDYDPTDDESRRPNPPVVGRCDTVPPEPVAVTFLESIRDYIETASATCIRPTVAFGEFHAGTTAHEVLHALSLGHDGDTTGGMMCAALKIFASQPNRNLITQGQRARLRSLVQPGVFTPVSDVSACTTVTCR